MDPRLRGDDRSDVSGLICTLKFRHQRLRTTRKQTNVRTHRDKQTTGVQPFARIGFHTHDDTRRFARFTDARDAVGDRCLHLGMTRIGEMAKIRRKILRTDKYPIDTGRCWVKLSPRCSAQATLPFDDVLPFVHALVKRAPERLLWGSDWPHPNYFNPMPNDADLLDLMLEWAPDEAARRRIMIDNPAERFGFN